MINGHSVPGERSWGFEEGYRKGRRVSLSFRKMLSKVAPHTDNLGRSTDRRENVGFVDLKQFPVSLTALQQPRPGVNGFGDLVFSPRISQKLDERLAQSLAN